MDDALDVVGVMDFHPAPTPHAFEARSGVVVRTLVVPVDRTSRVCSPDELAEIVDQFAEPASLSRNAYSFYRIREVRDAFPDRTTQMILNRDAAGSARMPLSQFLRMGRRNSGSPSAAVARGGRRE